MNFFPILFLVASMNSKDQYSILESQSFHQKSLSRELLEKEYEFVRFSVRRFKFKVITQSA